MLTAEGVHPLNLIINSAIDDGWQPFGSPFGKILTPDIDINEMDKEVFGKDLTYDINKIDKVHFFYQAMVIYKKDKLSYEDENVD